LLDSLLQETPVSCGGECLDWRDQHSADQILSLSQRSLETMDLCCVWDKAPDLRDQSDPGDPPLLIKISRSYTTGISTTATARTSVEIEKIDKWSS